MLLQRLATGTTGVKQARYRQGPTRHSYAHAQYTLVAVQCETMHGVRHPVPAYEFRRGFCTLVLYSLQQQLLLLLA